MIVSDREFDGRWVLHLVWPSPSRIRSDWGWSSQYVLLQAVRAAGLEDGRS